MHENNGNAYNLLLGYLGINMSEFLNEILVISDFIAESCRVFISSCFDLLFKSESLVYHTYSS